MWYTDTRKEEIFLKFENQFDSQGRMRILDGMRYYKKTNEQNNAPRLAIKLKEAVDEKCLEYAANIAMKRHKVFSMQVVGDEKRYYLELVNKKVAVQRDVEGERVVIGKNNNALTRIGYNEDEICIDFFHGISDGVGVLAFAKTLLFYYFKEKYGEEPEGCEGVILEDTPEDPREIADKLLFAEGEEVVFNRKYQYDKAYQIKDEQMASAIECKYYEMRINAAEFENFMRENSTSRAAMFSLFMNRVIAEHNGIFEEPVVAALAVNARPALGAEKTEQCCVETIPLWYDSAIHEMSLREQLIATREMLVEGMNADAIVASAQRTRKFNENMELKFDTLDEKREYAAMVNKAGGIKYTYGISYVGAVQYGNGIDKHVEKSYTKLCANTIPIIIEIVKCDEYYHISYCTHLEDDPYVMKLKNEYEKAGITCTVEQKSNYVEPLVIFK